MFPRLFALFAVFVLAGCSSGPRLGDAGTGTAVQITAGTDLPPPNRHDLLGNARPYLIGPFDRLTIDVFGVEDLSSKNVQTDASGRVSFPLVGVVEAAGKTTQEVAALIATRLQRYVRDPQVTVNIGQTVSQTLTIDGEVREPGIYPVIGGMSLTRAIATAKGATEFAKLSDVVVFRTVNGQRMAALYNLKAIRLGNYSDPELFANDLVIVGDSPARRIFKDVLSTAPLITAPLVAVLR